MASKFSLGTPLGSEHFMLFKKTFKKLNCRVSKTRIDVSKTPSY
jgi:hypothetical protein